jgi:hypothetical protein
MAAREEKLCGGPMHRSVDGLGIVSRPCFSGAVGSVQLCWVSVKGCHTWLVMSGRIIIGLMANGDLIELLY